ncbi:hypothetical protein N431DRAFT_445706 [Stipitochalara longipes BDJ]|nr:hypothetical protein N431DRAFT_445706 [Stipitochalara longipes BDJ]
MPTFTPFNCFTPATTSSSQPSPLRYPEGATPHSVPNLSHHHRNNGYEDLTLHLTQSHNQLRERSRSGDGSRRLIRDLVRSRRVRDAEQERGREGEREGERERNSSQEHADGSTQVVRTFVRERREMGASRERVTAERIAREGAEIRSWGREVVEAAEAAERKAGLLGEVGNQMVVESRTLPKNIDNEDDILELDLDGGVTLETQRAVEHEHMVVERGRMEVAEEDNSKGQEEDRRWILRRERDCCTSEERRRIDEWIAACETARCKGFVKRIKGRTEVNERAGNIGEVNSEERVSVRGGGNLGWPEWGLGWGAQNFMK